MMTRTLLHIACACAALSCHLGGRDATAQETAPLHRQIDQLVESRHVGPLPALTTDAEFIRRVYLDLTGSVPSSSDVRVFLADSAQDKRQRLIDRLLESAEFERHMATQLDVMLMERLPDKNVKEAEWIAYLRSSLAEDKPLNQLAREILNADGTPERNRAAAKFYLDRDAEPNRLTRDVGRVFFGMDLQCAQCHDHPIIGDYLQRDYYGIHAFFGRTSLFTDPKSKLVTLMEKAEGETSFKSVFTEESGSTRPRIPGGEQIEEPTFAKDDAYVVKPAKNTRHVPKFSRRDQLAKLATDGSSEVFNRNFANRLWAMMLGQGIVNPVDLHSYDNPASLPELLELLAQQLVQRQFNLRSMLREIALSKTYQRQSVLPGETTSNLAQHEETLRTLTERIRLAQETVDATEQAWEAKAELAIDAERQFQEVMSRWEPLSAKQQEHQQARDKATAALNSAEESMAALKSSGEVVSAAVGAAEHALTLLPNEQRVQTTVQILREKREALSKTLGEAQAQRDAFAQSVQEAQAALAALNPQLEALRPQYQTITAARDQADQVSGTARQAWEKAKQQLAQLTEKLSDVELIVSMSRAEGLLTQQSVALRAQRQQLHEVTQRVQQATQQRSLITKELGTAEQALAQAASQHRELATQVQSAKSAAAYLSRAAQEVGQAMSLLRTETELADLCGQLESLAETQANQAAELAQRQQQMNERMDKLTIQRQQDQAQLSKLDGELNSWRQQQEQFESATAALEAKCQACDEQLTTETATLAQRWETRFALAGLKPLTPEQLAWSVLQATGQVDRQRAAVIAELNKKKPLSVEDQQDAEKVRQRELEIQSTTEAKLAGSVKAFVQLFANAAGEPQDPFFATVDQALFFANGGQLQAWLAPSGGSLVARLKGSTDPQHIAEEMYLSVLSRMPSETELSEFVTLWPDDAAQQLALIQNACWALLTSAEFRFNH